MIKARSLLFSIVASFLLRHLDAFLLYPRTAGADLMIFALPVSPAAYGGFSSFYIFILAQYDTTNQEKNQ
jgi:hypothetical protein